MSTLVLEAEPRETVGKGASRRLRRLENKIPAILYGGDKKPQPLYLQQNKLNKALESNSIYSTVFDLNIKGKVQQVILKDLQRHPYKPTILHLDLQRVSAKDVLVKQIPLHFINEQDAKGVKEGGVVSHLMTQVEVRCQAQHLPEFIEVDIADVELNQVLHLSDLKLPKGVELSTVIDEAHDLPVMSIHQPKKVVLDEEESVSVSTEEGAAEEASEEPSAEDKSTE